jgi:hypothetical protein
MTSNGYGLIPAASTRPAVLSYWKQSTQCSDGTVARKSAIPICLTSPRYKVLNELTTPNFATVYGLPVAGRCRSFLLHVT